VVDRSLNRKKGKMDHNNNFTVILMKFFFFSFSFLLVHFKSEYSSLSSFSESTLISRKLFQQLRDAKFIIGL